MKKISSLFIIAIFGTFSHIAYALEVSSKVSAVTLYPNKARETRIGKLNISQTGEQEIIFTEISRYLDGQSVQVSIPGVNILSVTTRTNYLGKKTDQAQLKMWKDSLQDIQDKRAWQLEKIAVAQGELKLYEQNLSVAGDHTEHFTKAVNDLANLYSANTLKIREKLLQLKKEDKKLEETLQRLQNQINNAGPQNQPIQEIVVNVDAQKPGSWDYQLQYLVSNASWQPMYDIHTAQIHQPLQVKMKAKIVQQTGYDWNGVQLTLSTAQPQSQQKMPVWKTDFVDYYVNSISSSRFELQEVVVASYSAKSISKNKAEDADGILEEGYIVEVAQTATAQNYQISRTQNIPSTTDAHFVEMTHVEVPALFQYESYPKRDAAVFLMAKIPQWENYNFLNAPANVFFEGTYIGQIPLSAKVVSDTLDISLGRDELVFVERKELNNVTSKKVIGSTKREDKTFEITVKNNKKTAVEVIVYDQIPVSRQKDIEVTLNNSDKADYNPETGKLTWKVSLKAGESRKIKFDYTIKYPSNKVIEVK